MTIGGRSARPAGPGESRWYAVLYGVIVVFYARLKRKKGDKNAKVAASAKLLKVAFRVQA